MDPLTRRTFLSTYAATAAMAQEPKIRLGIIGCGWYGLVDWGAAVKTGGVEVTGICDVDTAHLAEAAAAIEKQQPGKPKQFKKYEDLLAMRELDAVIIATPPHWHALPFIAACRRGVAIYEEKPLSYDVREGQAMIAAQKKAGNTVQIGFQRRASEAVRQARDYIRSGTPGRIVQVDVRIHYTAAPLDNRPQDPPSTLDWDTWCGPGPKLPYSPNIGHKAWRLEEAYGNGHLVDWGIHLIDATRYILGEGIPKRVTAVGGLYEYKGRITTPDTLTAHFEFDTCPVVWRHRLWGAVEYAPEVSNGIFFYGEQETVFVTDQRWMVIPKGRGAQKKITDIQPPTDLGQRHMADFLAAVRAKAQPAVSTEDGWRSTTTVQLAMISYKTGRSVAFDPNTVSIVNDETANKLLMRPYRAPYKHPYQA